MIDYLEEALTEEQEEETLQQGRRTAVRPPKKKRPEEPEAGGAKSLQAEEAGQEEIRVPSEDGTEETLEQVLSPEEWVPPALREVLRKEGRLPLAEERTEAAGILLQALSRTGRSLRALRSGPGVLTVSLPGESGGTAAGTDLESLDLAMQRDARRYDGGFPLY